MRNLAITGKRSFAKKNVYVDVEPEHYSFRGELARLGLPGGDDHGRGDNNYNGGSDQGRPKTALKLIREKGGLESIPAEQEERGSRFAQIRKFFLHPDVTDDYEIKMKKPRVDEMYLPGG